MVQISGGYERDKTRNLRCFPAKTNAQLPCYTLKKNLCPHLSLRKTGQSSATTFGTVLPPLKRLSCLFDFERRWFSEQAPQAESIHLRLAHLALTRRVVFEAVCGGVKALKFQQMAWETVTRYPKNCLGATPVSDFVGAAERLRFPPTPATDYLTLDYPGSEQAWSLFDQSGRPIQSGTGRQVGLKGLPPGVYFVQVGRFFGRFVKRY